MSGPLFELHRAEVAQRGMAADPIIKSFQIRKDFRSCLLLCQVAAGMEQFCFERGKEALDHRVVSTIAGTAHRTLDAKGDQPLLIGSRHILAPAI